ncbi:hypothetical protein [Streptomyces sp. NPDC057702]|uniref:hypothetical protein n=1 Tax=unclassified Streptomyces TaxID=2593676 RepID=UPI0036D1B64D
MSVGLLSAIGVASYGATISLLALTATFARTASRRHEARATLAVITPGAAPTTTPPAPPTSTSPPA